MEFRYTNISFDLPYFSSSPIWLFGKSYSPENNGSDDDSELLISDSSQTWATFLADFNSLFWFTYRKGFLKIEPSGLTSDVGWGCMLRTGQMCLCQAFSLHLLGPNWRLEDYQSKPNKQVYNEIMGWFYDHPSKPYSIHRIAQVGLKFGKDVGEWLGPATIAQILECLVFEHSPKNFGMYVSSDGCIYLDKIKQICGELPNADLEAENEEKLIKDDTNWKSLLLIIPLRLGLDKLNPLYISVLQETFKFPQSLGILGGRPRSSFYFVAVQDEDVLYLDPHVLQPLENSEEGVMPSYHCGIPKRMKLSDIDPSLALAFYCRTKEDFDDFCERSKDMNAIQTIYNISEKTPGYLRKPKEIHCTEKFFSDDEDDVVFL
eukprot:TRINITY_DN1882_c0_g1_i1.p1 TRINITY_DN1882_c0_g1~~TRINITY_DN1882_c0_g1_i1.p1  ORF type:complete len:375 (+),score=71.38 TRINITY_DN1882_c0_g1_i1:286-1410(+)